MDAYQDLWVAAETDVTVVGICAEELHLMREKRQV
jgi:hypothetical protein